VHFNQVHDSLLIFKSRQFVDWTPTYFHRRDTGVANRDLFDERQMI
jgi:hypothetical protein